MTTKQTLLRQISQADPETLDHIAQAVMERYGVLYPETEVVYLALPRHDIAERKRRIGALVDCVDKYTPLP